MESWRICYAVGVTFVFQGEDGSKGLSAFQKIGRGPNCESFVACIAFCALCSVRYRVFHPLCSLLSDKWKVQDVICPPAFRIAFFVRCRMGSVT